MLMLIALCFYLEKKKNNICRSKNRSEPWLKNCDMIQTVEHVMFYSPNSYGRLRITSEPNIHVFGLCEETRVLGENPHKHRENMQTLHSQAPRHHAQLNSIQLIPKGKLHNSLDGPFHLWMERHILVFDQGSP